MIYNFGYEYTDKNKNISYNTDEKYILDLSNKQLTELPLNIENTRVKKLILTKNKLTNINKLFDGILVDFLEELYINWNEIKYIPKTIKKLKKIKILVIADNYLTTIPDEIYNLITLTHLYFDYFPISVPYTESPQSSGGAIKASNKIKSISPNIKNLTELEDFSVCSYYCESLPKEIGNLQKLNLTKGGYNQHIFCDNDNAIVYYNYYREKPDIRIPANIFNINIVYGDNFNYNNMPSELEHLTICFYGESIPVINNLPCLLKTINLNIYNSKANSTIGNIRLPFGTQLIINNISTNSYSCKYGEYMNDDANRYPLYNCSRIESCYLNICFDEIQIKIETEKRRKKEKEHMIFIQKLVNDKINLC